MPSPFDFIRNLDRIVPGGVGTRAAERAEELVRTDPRFDGTAARRAVERDRDRQARETEAREAQRLRNLQATKSALLDQLAGGNAKATALTQDIARLNSDIAAQQDRLSAAVAELERRDAEQRRLEQEAMTLEQEIASLRQQLDALNRRIAELEAQKLALTQRLAAIEAQINSLV